MIAVSEDLVHLVERAGRERWGGYAALLDTRRPLRDVADAIAAVFDQWAEDLDTAEGDDEGFEFWGPIATPWGAAIKISKFQTSSISLRWTAELLDRAGLVGTLSPLPDQHPGNGWSQHRDVVSDDLILAAWIDLAPSGTGRPRDAPRWFGPGARPVDEHLVGSARDLMHLIARWGMSGRAPSSRVVLGGSLMEYAVPASVDEQEIVRCFSDTAVIQSGGARLLVEGPTTARQVDIDSESGVVVLTEFVRQPWADVSGPLASLADALRTLVPWATYGRIRRLTGRWDVGCHVDVNTWPARTGTPAYQIPQDLRQVTDGGDVPDVFGIQFLGRDIARRLDAAALNDNWRVGPVGPGLLVETRHPQAWFGEDQPDLDHLAQARREFSDLLVPPRQSDRRNP